VKAGSESGLRVRHPLEAPSKKPGERDRDRKKRRKKKAHDASIEGRSAPERISVKGEGRNEQQLWGDVSLNAT